MRDRGHGRSARERCVDDALGVLLLIPEVDAVVVGRVVGLLLEDLLQDGFVRLAPADRDAEPLVEPQAVHGEGLGFEVVGELPEDVGVGLGEVLGP